MDFVEGMEVQDGLIRRHCVYWAGTASRFFKKIATVDERWRSSNGCYALPSLPLIRDTGEWRIHMRPDHPIERKGAP
jgi:hypothetical protein